MEYLGLSQNHNGIYIPKMYMNFICQWTENKKKKNMQIGVPYL